MDSLGALEEKFRKVQEKAFVFSDTRFVLPHERNIGLAEQYFSGLKAWQQNVICAGNFVECDQYSTPEKAAQRIASYKKGFREQFARNPALSGAGLEREIEDAIFSIDPLLGKKDLNAFFKAFAKLVACFHGRTLNIVQGNLDSCLEKLYKEYLSGGGAELNVRFLHSGEALKIGKVEFYSIECLDNFPRQELEFERQVSEILQKVEKSPEDSVKVLLSSIPSTRANSKIGSKKINELLKTGLFDFHFFGHRPEQSGRTWATTVEFKGSSKKVGFYNAFIERISKLRPFEEKFEEFVEKPATQTTISEFGKRPNEA